MVGIEAGKQMDNVIGQSHHGFNSGSFKRRFVEGTVRGNDTQPSFRAGVHSLDIGLAAKRVDHGPRFLGGKRIAKFRLDTSLWRCLNRGWIWGYPIGLETVTLIYNKNLIGSPPTDLAQLVSINQEPSESQFDCYAANRLKQSGPP